MQRASMFAVPRSTGAPAKVLPGGADFSSAFSRLRPSRRKATLILDYSGEISRKNSSGLVSEQGGDQWTPSPNSSRWTARQRFSMFRRARVQSAVKLRLKVKRDQVALSNTPVVSEEHRRRLQDRSIRGDQTAAQLSGGARGSGPSTWSMPGLRQESHAGADHRAARKERGGAVAKETSPQVLNELEAYFGNSPILTKSSIASTCRSCAGAMENPGLITFAQRLILSPPDRETTAVSARVRERGGARIRAPMVRDLVTTAWWDDIWLNEAFATWTERTILSKWKPEWHEDVSAVVRTNDAMRTDNLVSARRIRAADRREKTTCAAPSTASPTKRAPP